MDKIVIPFKINIFQETKFEISDLISFMQSIDADFEPPLSSYVDIPKYCEKIVSLSSIFVAHYNEIIIGLIAFYCNDKSNYLSYISYLGVAQEARGHHIGQELLYNAISLAKFNLMKVIRIRTWERNVAALNLYKRIGFDVIGEERDRADASKSIWLELILNSQPTSNT